MEKMTNSLFREDWSKEQLDAEGQNMSNEARINRLERKVGLLLKVVDEFVMRKEYHKGRPMRKAMTRFKSDKEHEEETN